MQVFTKTEEFKSALAEIRSKSPDNGTKSHRLAFVPTMGYLHEGHLSLVKIASEHAPLTVVSIFVNPLQFNNPEDLEKYPRNTERDIEMLAQAGTDLVFIPEASDILPAENKKLNYQPVFAKDFEARFRPGHFEGVCTIVKILFEITEPDYAVFGEKDFQQLRIIEKMVQDFNLAVKILRGPTMRDPDGLAKSSRNVRLSNEERTAALCLNRALTAASKTFKKGVCSASEIKTSALNEISKTENIKLEYLEVIDPQTFCKTEVLTSESRVILAAYAGQIRLIDNMQLA